MRYVRLLGFAALAGLAVTAISCSVALAVELPTLLPEPTTKAPLTFTGQASKPVLNTLKASIEGTEATLTKATVVKEENNLGLEAELIFKGLKNGTAKCSTAGASAEEVKLKVAMTLVTIKESTNLRGALLIEVPTTVIKCGVVSDELKGGMIGKFEKSKGVALSSLERVLTPGPIFSESKAGEQTFLKCESPKADCEKEHTLEANFGGGFEKAALEAFLSLTFNKEMEMHF